MKLTNDYLRTECFRQMEKIHTRCRLHRRGHAPKNKTQPHLKRTANSTFIIFKLDELKLNEYDVNDISLT